MPVLWIKGVELGGKLVENGGLAGDFSLADFYFQFFVCNNFLLQVLYLHGLHGAYPVVA